MEMADAAQRAGQGHGAIDILGLAGSNMRQHFAGCRVLCGEGRAAGGVAEFTVEVGLVRQCQVGGVLLPVG